MPWTLSAGRWGLVVWLVGGMALETLHLVKAPSYLEDSLRRELWTLAHAHGALLSAVGLLLVVLVPRLALAPARLRRIDRLTTAGLILLPLGFLLGGIAHGEADPSPFVVLVPVGAVLLAVALVLVALARRR
jgi:hypothetical protein